ncbi:MAG: outer membrane beta-barrel protein [Flavobacteriaceae bacterium]|jgi:hypothetical protein
MKLYPTLFFFMIASQLGWSQLKYGIKGGLNFDSAGEIKLVSEQLQKEGNLDSKSGFHVGAYAEVDFLIFYLRPELQYTKVSNQFEGNTIENDRIELPVSLGVTVFGPLSFFLGPTAFYSLSQQSEELNFEAVKSKTSLGMHVGTRVQLGPIGVDLRYERGFSAVESRLLSEAGLPTTGQIDTRANQFTIGVSFKLN